MKRLTRRNFLQSAACVSCMSAAEPLVKPALVFAESSVNPNAAGRFFVEVKLHGGHDGLYLFPPSQSTAFNALKAIRPELMGQTGTFSEVSHVRAVNNSPLGVHPLMGNAPSGGISVHSLINSGKGRILSRIAPRIQDRSHEVAQNLWLSGDMYGTPSSATHWVARLMDTHAASLSATQVWRLGELSGFAFSRSNGDYPMTLESLSQFRLNDRGANFGGDAEARATDSAAKDLLDLQVDLQPHEEQLRDFIKQSYSRELDARPIGAYSTNPICNTGVPQPCYHNERISLRFRDAAKIIRYYANNTANERIYIQLNFGNFDTHSGEIQSLNGFMPFFNAALNTFIADLGGENSATWGRTAVYVTSEFGRTLRQNTASIPELEIQPGTEHGYGNVTALFSGGLNPSRPLFLGGDPSFDFTNSDVLGFSIDMVQVYWEILSWMGFDPSPVFPEYAPNTGPGRTSLNIFT